MLVLRPRLAAARLRMVTSALVLTAAAAASAAPAAANPGYELDPSKPSIRLGGELPVGVAVDQVSRKVHVAELTRGLISREPGQVEQFDASLSPTPDSPFTKPGEAYFSAVAVNPMTQGIYAYQLGGLGPSGEVLGVSQIDTFSSTGTPGASFSVASSAVGSLASDASGRVYFPNSTAGTVQVFNSSGTLQETITCGGCFGGAFVKPVGVAFDTDGDLYVVDNGGGGRVVELSPSAGSFAYHSTLPGSAGAVAVAVDPTSGETFVGTIAGSGYHVLAYTSAGVQFDDFGAGLSTRSPYLEEAVGQLGVDGTSHKLYLTDPGGSRLSIFNRLASIHAPVAAVVTPTSVGQIEATLKGTVDPEGHTLSNCHFEFVDDVSFQSDGYADATSIPCPAVVGDSNNRSVSARVSGLSPETAYDYRLLASSYGGDDESDDQAFTTLPPLPPAVTSGSASAIGLSGATLGGVVNPKGGPISSCSFQYATATTFAANGFSGALAKACSPNPSGAADVSVSAKITGLSPATEYRFRVVATNNSGTIEATEKPFTTAAETCSTNPALCPAPEQTPPSTAPIVVPPVSIPLPTVPTRPKPLRCRKGFRKKRVHGKAKCVKVKKRVKRRHRRHS